jgi:guanylate kinase
VQETSPEAVTIFIAAPSFEELERRLRERATESSGVIEERLEVARRQMEEASLFGHVVVNDDVERAVAELDEIVTSALTTTGRLSPT